VISAADLTKALKVEAERLGFAQCGIARADAFDGQIPLSSWLDAGHHGTMEWMETRKVERAAPQQLWPDARHIIALGMSYAPKTSPLALENAKNTGRISVYAQGSDYHDVVKRNLKALARWLVDAGGGELKVFVDTAPVMEKPLAQVAGIGWQGKHTNIVSRLAGSWLFLGCIMTTLDLEPDVPHADACGNCDACQRACPTDAFPTPYTLDARRCISYLTIEHKGLIPLEFRTAIGNRIYGCDDCLAVCPWNKFASRAGVNLLFYARAELAAPDLADLLALDDKSFRTVFAGSPIKRIGRNRLVRNAAIAAGNSGNPGFVPALQSLTNDPDPVIIDAANWALSRLLAPDERGHA
jgi:epoxyqueuosine reductase